MHPKALWDLSKVDPNTVVADIETIRESNPRSSSFWRVRPFCSGSNRTLPTFSRERFIGRSHTYSVGEYIQK